jgi:hypothetical protein
MTDPQDIADQASTLSAGFGILTVQIFPFALPLLLLCIAPLLPLIVVGLLLAAIIYPPLKLIRYFTTRKRRSVSWPEPAEAVRSRPIRANPGPP